MRLHAAPDGVTTEAEVSTLLSDLAAHAHKDVREWAAWAARPIVKYLMFPHVFSRLDQQLLTAAPATTVTNPESGFQYLEQVAQT